MPAKKANKLTKKQLAFCEQYVIDRNASQAAIRAGFSEKTAKETSYKLLQKDHIKIKINELVGKASEKAEIDAAYVLEGIQRIALNAEADKNHSSALKGFELLGKYLKLFTDVQEQKHTFTQMGEVKIGDQPLIFNVGDEPNEPE